MELTERDRAILEFERSWWSEGGPKEALIVERFELSASRYYQILGELLDSDAATPHHPLVLLRVPPTGARRRGPRAASPDAAATVDATSAVATGGSGESAPEGGPS